MEKPFCANNGGAAPKMSGWNETWANNRCIMGDPSSTYAYSRCNPDQLEGTVDNTWGNEFFTPDASVSFKCQNNHWTLEQYQQRGFDLGLTVHHLPTSAQIVAWAEEILEIRSDPSEATLWV